MTVAAVILAASPDSALADADGLPAVRRISDVAWAGGATPIVVVSFDPAGAVATALAGAPVTLAEPAPVESGPVGQMVRGITVAIGLMHEIDAVLIWPARLTWVGPETVTSLVEAHGVMAGEVLRPEYDGAPGWPILLPIEHLDVLRAIAPEVMPDLVADRLAATLPARALDLGDPGTTIDRSTPRTELPPYDGPSEPAANHVHEWGAEVADEADDGPLAGPALAPYAPAAAGEVEPG